MSKTTNANVENTLWENQSEEYKSSILSTLKIERHLQTRRKRNRTKTKGFLERNTGSNRTYSYSK